MNPTDEDYRDAHREANEPDAATLARLAGEERAVVLVRPAKDVEEM